MSESGTGSADGVIPPMGAGEGSFQMSDIYYLLLAEFGELAELAENSKRLVNENHPKESWISQLEAPQNRQKDTQEVQSVYKQKLLESLSKTVEDAKPLGEPLHTAHVSLELRAKLLEKVKQDRQSIEQMTAEVSQLQDSTKEISRKTEELQRMIETRPESGEMPTKFKWDEIHRKIRQERTKLINNLRHVTETLCPDSDVEQILNDALKQKFLGKDPYISVQAVSSEDVEFLIRCSLITRHPHDPLLIRLRDQH